VGSAGSGTAENGPKIDRNSKTAAQLSGFPHGLFDFCNMRGPQLQLFFSGRPNPSAAPQTGQKSPPKRQFSRLNLLVRLQGWMHSLLAARMTGFATAPSLQGIGPADVA
jgi:hypothetical protein